MKYMHLYIEKEKCISSFAALDNADHIDKIVFFFIYQEKNFSL